MKQGVFITATGTGTGKTLVACVLARLLSRNFRVGVMKPFASGSRVDAARLRWAARRDDLNLDEINPVYYNRPLSPFTATGFGARQIPWSEILKVYDRLSEACDVMIVEGVGGLHVPLSAARTVADLAAMTGLGLLVVANPWLGTLNHTLLTLHYAASKKLRVRAVLFNHARRIKDFSSATNARALRRLTSRPVLGPVPYGAGTFRRKVRRLVQLDVFRKDCLKVLAG